MQATPSLKQSLNIINFSHPVPDDDTSIAALIDHPDGYQIIDIPVQLDLDTSLVPQVECLVDQAESLIDTAAIAAVENLRNIDLIRLPGLADAAALIITEFQARGYTPGILRFARVDATPPRFEAVEVIQLKQSKEVGIWKIHWTTFTWALEAVHGQTPRDLWNAYRKIQEEASK